MPNPAGNATLRQCYETNEAFMPQLFFFCYLILGSQLWGFTGNRFEREKLTMHPQKVILNLILPKPSRHRVIPAPATGVTGGDALDGQIAAL